MKRVLITGAAGLVGGILGRSLGVKYDISGIDAVAAPGFDSVQADISDLTAILPAFQGIDVVIHLAADSRQDSPWESVVKHNIIGTHNVLEGARQSDIKRVIFASSNHVTGMYERDHPYSAIVRGRYEGLSPGGFPMINHRMPIRADGFYGASKAFGEALGRYYNDQFGMSVICLRIGTVNVSNDPLASVRHFATLCTHRDLVQLVERCLDSEYLGFDIFYGVSDNTWRFWDIEHAGDRIGYAPIDNAESFRGEAPGA